MIKHFKIAVLLVLTISGGQVLANDCETYLENAEEARRAIVADFSGGKSDSLDQGINDLVFWSNYVNVKCGEGGLTKTPITWISQHMGEFYEPNAYKVGFLLWLQENEVDPTSLVQGRSFSQ